MVEKEIDKKPIDKSQSKPSKQLPPVADAAGLQPGQSDPDKTRIFTDADAPTEFQQEPLAEFNKEPLAEFNKEPSALGQQEPTALVQKEPSALVQKEPSAEFNKEPSAAFEKEPSALVDPDATQIIAPKAAKDLTRFQPAQASPPVAQPTTTPSVNKIMADSSVTTNASHAEGFARAKQMLEVVATEQGKKVIKHRFVLEQVLGGGGMGVVYKAQDLRKIEAKDRNPYVAIKVLNDSFKHHPDAFIALQREARKSQQLSHPNIVNVYDFDRDGDMVFMTMEYLKGMPLDKLIKQHHGIGLQDAKLSLELVKGMCEALIRAHNESIIHSDFKPGNVFVTEEQQAKVFDFGIARAVSQVGIESTGIGGDRTLFDPGELGALTPAYASLEMLNGKQPDQRDDIYALGCVVYEIYAGVHPYGKKNARQACEEKLRPKRIKALSRSQWRALEKSLSFERADRLASVDEFLRAFVPSKRSRILMAGVAASLVLLSAGLVYSQFYGNAPDTAELRTELEAEVKFDLQRERILELVGTPTFSLSWENDLAKEVRQARQLFGNQDNWLMGAEQYIIELYLQRVGQLSEQAELESAQKLLERAELYGVGSKQIQQARVSVDQQLGMQQEQQARQLQVRQDQLAEQQRQQAAKLAAERQRLVSERDRLRRQQQQKNLLAAVDQSLNCDRRFNPTAVSRALHALTAFDQKLYRQRLDGYAQSYADCLVGLAAENFEQAQKYRQLGLQMFGQHQTIQALRLQPKDVCPLSLAGLGNKGLRASCRDPLDIGGLGPRLVVIPKRGAQAVFAIGKYEISVAEYNQYCQQTGQCQTKNSAADLPVTGISVQQAQGYVAWLSQQTGRQYSLPSVAQWRHAAQAQNGAMDPNRNCQLDSRGIQKGDRLLPVGTGMQNPWGLVNHVGNSQEWAWSGEQLKALGGSRLVPMSDCSYLSQTQHNGQADPVTGFRVARKLDL